MNGLKNPMNGLWSVGGQDGVVAKKIARESYCN